jgi:hypothetical protein
MATWRHFSASDEPDRPGCTHVIRQEQDNAVCVSAGPEEVVWAEVGLIYMG